MGAESKDRGAIILGVSGRILVGSCSWADKTLVDSGWYPRSARSAEERLRYYANQFLLVEVDSTYYAIPLRRNSELWVERTPADFTFDVKAYALFTGHAAVVQALPADVRLALPEDVREKRSVYAKDLPEAIVSDLWERFNEVLLPLDSAGKLGTVLFQYPPWFGPRRDNREAILQAKQRLGQYRMAVEFRNGAWMRDIGDQERTLKFLRDNGVTYVCVDEPQGFKSSVPPVVAATAPIATTRMHGRNASAWEVRSATAAERFDYLYDEAELAEWAPRIERLAAEADEVHVLMNNCHGDYSVRNAHQIGEMLGVLNVGGADEELPQGRLV